jgi:hypothetical protein
MRIEKAAGQQPGGFDKGWLIAIGVLPFAGERGLQIPNESQSS